MAELLYIYGAMNSGKSIEILKTAHNYEEQNKPVLIFTSALDNRDEVGYVSSRIGLRRKAVAVYDHTDMYSIVKGHDKPIYCVLVDEVKFLRKNHILQMVRIVDSLSQVSYKSSLIEGVYICIVK